MFCPISTSMLHFGKHNFHAAVKTQGGRYGLAELHNTTHDQLFCFLKIAHASDHDGTLSEYTNAMVMAIDLDDDHLQNIITRAAHKKFMVVSPGLFEGKDDISPLHTIQLLLVVYQTGAFRKHEQDHPWRALVVSIIARELVSCCAKINALRHCKLVLETEVESWGGLFLEDLEDATSPIIRANVGDYCLRKVYGSLPPLEDFLLLGHVKR